MNDRRLEAVGEGDVVGRLRGAECRPGVDGPGLCRCFCMGGRHWKAALAGELHLAEGTLTEIGTAERDGRTIAHVAHDQTFGQLTAQASVS